MISSPSGLLYLSKITEIVKELDFTPLQNGIDYEIVINPLVSANVVSETELLLSEPLLYLEQGDAIFCNINGYPFKRIVNNISEDGLSILLTNELKDKDDNYVKAGIIDVKRVVDGLVKLNEVDEGIYLVRPTNQKFIVRNSWTQPFIHIHELVADIKDVESLEEYRLNSVNKLALKMIFADLARFGNYYDIITEIDLWQLMYKKVVCILSSDYQIVRENFDPCKDYRSELYRFKPSKKIVQDSSGKSTEKIEIMQGAEWSL